MEILCRETHRVTPSIVFIPCAFHALQLSVLKAGPLGRGLGCREGGTNKTPRKTEDQAVVLWIPKKKRKDAGEPRTAMTAQMAVSPWVEERMLRDARGWRRLASFAEAWYGKMRVASPEDEKHQQCFAHALSHQTLQ